MTPHDGPDHRADRSAGDPNPVRTRCRRIRRAELGVGWVVVAAFVAGIVLGGPWFLFIPALGLGVLVAANTVAAARRHGPEEQALTPGRLARVAPDHDPVAVPASRSPRRRAPDRERQDGTLSYADGRLRFTVDPGSPGSHPGVGGPHGLALIDAEPWELRLGPAPTLWRPQLVLVHGTTTHVLDLCPGWDVATVGVGVHVAGEWHRQLAEIGVTPS